MSSDEQASGLADASPDFDPPAEVPSAPRGALDVLVVTAAAIPIVAFLLHETYSLDVWWQVVVGKGILASGELPHVDV